MQSINKIHVNSSTQLSLNDRFTSIQKAGPALSPARKNVGRIRSQSVPRGQRAGASVPRASAQNRQFLQQLDNKHKHRLAQKLTRNNLRASLPARQQLTNRTKNRVSFKKTAVVHTGRLNRASSVSNVRTMQADFLVGQNTMRRRNSVAGLSARLGNRGSAPVATGHPRRRLNRSNIPSDPIPRNRSRSRQPLPQATNVKRSNSRPRATVPPQRNNARPNLNNSRPQANVPAPVRVRRRSTGVAQRPRINRNNIANSAQLAQLTVVGTNRRGRRNQNIAATTRAPVVRQRPNATGARNGSNARVARGTVARRGVGGKAVLQGRVLKRQNANNNGKVGQRGARAEVGAKQRLGRSNSRVAQAKAVARTRSVSRGGRINRPGNNANKTNVQQNRSRKPNNSAGANAAAAKGRSRSRARGGGRPIIDRKVTPKSKEDLDNELDQYMVSTKTHGDSFLGGL